MPLEPYRGTCIADVGLEFFDICYDGAGSCTWTESSEGGVRRTVLEWENGARSENVTSRGQTHSTLQAASGERCTLEPVDEADCLGFDASSPSGGYRLCVEIDQSMAKITRTHYTCDDGTKHTFDFEELQASAPMCSLNLLDRFESCADAEGRRYLDSQRGTPRPMCSGDSCGDIGARCTAAMACDSGLTCRSTHVDPAVVYGYCSGPCDDATPCGAGTTCTSVLDRASGKIE